MGISAKPFNGNQIPSPSWPWRSFSCLWIMANAMSCSRSRRFKHVAFSVGGKCIPSISIETRICRRTALASGEDFVNSSLPSAFSMLSYKAESKFASLIKFCTSVTASLADVTYSSDGCTLRQSSAASAILQRSLDTASRSDTTPPGLFSEIPLMCCLDVSTASSAKRGKSAGVLRPSIPKRHPRGFCEKKKHRLCALLGFDVNAGRGFCEFRVPSLCAAQAEADSLRCLRKALISSSA
mmetsp:Transcript_44227/g.99495  ORF Transcript_44227/g.99495 Transcript_44227/m.99495 type:complete len:239 (+) Transcript_44227:1468-2184(+)